MKNIYDDAKDLHINRKIVYATMTEESSEKIAYFNLWEDEEHTIKVKDKEVKEAFLNNFLLISFDDIDFCTPIECTGLGIVFISVEAFLELGKLCMYRFEDEE